MPAPFEPRNTTRARSLRHAATPAERHLWTALRASALGAKFCRQMPLGPYFADFLCRDLKLVNELDGVSHETSQARDAARDAWMAAQGYRVLRFAPKHFACEMRPQKRRCAGECGGGGDRDRGGGAGGQIEGPPLTPPACGRGWGQAFLTSASPTKFVLCPRKYPELLRTVF